MPGVPTEADRAGHTVIVSAVFRLTLLPDRLLVGVGTTVFWFGALGLE